MSESRIVARLFFPITFFFAAVCAGLGAGEIPDSAVSTGADYRGVVERETFFLINEYRKASELPPLAWDGAIARVARAHSKDMATGEVDFGHAGFRERVRRLSSVMTGLRGAGENVFMTDNLDQVARHAVALWLRSPHHLENIRGDYNYSGLGVWQDRAGTIYFTQIFVKIQPPTEETEAPPSSPVITSYGMPAAPETPNPR